jgi:hypothetical protein
MARTGIVADATVGVLAAALADELSLDEAELRRIAARQVAALLGEGYRVTVPVAALAPSARRTAGA